MSQFYTSIEISYPNIKLIIFDKLLKSCDVGSGCFLYLVNVCTYILMVGVIIIYNLIIYLKIRKLKSTNNIKKGLLPEAHISIV